MNTFSRSIIDSMLKNRIISEQDKEIYLFGCIFMLRTMANVLTLVLIGFVFKMTMESIVFVVFSLLIRSYAGGFHSDNPVICYLISVLAVLLMLLSIILGIWNLNLSVVLLLLSIGTILLYAPVEYKNKTLEDIERKVYRKRLFTVICILIIILFLFTLFDFVSLLFAGSLAFVVSALMVWIGKRRLLDK